MEEPSLRSLHVLRAVGIPQVLLYGHTTARRSEECRAEWTSKGKGELTLVTCPLGI